MLIIFRGAGRWILKPFEQSQDSCFPHFQVLCEDNLTISSWLLFHIYHIKPDLKKNPDTLQKKENNHISKNVD